MSHEIIKAITINHKTKQVFFTSASNNVYPRTPRKWHCEYLTKMYEDEGLAAVEKYILESYLGGMSQGGSNDWNNSIKAYPNGGDIEKAYSNLLLYRSLKKYKCVIKNGNNFIKQVTARRAVLTENPAAAKVFKEPEALIILKRFSDHGLTIETVA